MKAISVIVPVYNGQEHLRRCMESILVQLRQEDEILLINDGSTDESEQIIQEYCKRYPTQIRYDTIPHKGVAATRNLGIQKAQKEYILFLDSDDYWDNHLIATIQPYLEQEIELVKFKLQRVSLEGKTLEKVGGATFETINGQEAFNQLAFSDVLLDSPCVYAFQKKLFTREHFSISSRNAA